jgi:uncharacterized delta-60 repeat protein
MENRLSLPAYAGVVLAVSLTLTPTVGRADAGNLDPAFGIGGKVVTDFAAGIDVANGVAVQADGRIVVVGRAVTSLGSDAALARCNPDGSLDTSFGNSGLVTTHFPTSLSSFGDAEWFDVGIDADGRIVVAGLVLTSSSVTLRDFAVARYDTNGSLDTTFGGAGFVTTPSPFNADGVGGLALQADGKIVVAGLLFVAATGGRDFALMRYSTNGTLDTSFGTGGIVTTSFPSSSDDGAVDLAIQTDGNIVAVGNAAFVSTLGDFAIVRYNPDGSPGPPHERGLNLRLGVLGRGAFRLRERVRRLGGSCGWGLLSTFSMALSPRPGLTAWAGLGPGRPRGPSRAGPARAQLVSQARLCQQARSSSISSMRRLMVRVMSLPQSRP